MIRDREIRVEHDDLVNLLHTLNPVNATDILLLAQSLRFVLRALDKIAQRLVALERRKK